MKGKITIRPVEVGDAEAIQGLISDPLVAETTSNIPHPYPKGGAEAWIIQALDRWGHGSAYSFAVLAADKFVGSISILDVTDQDGEIGYWIGRPYWGQGFATAAGQKVVSYAFKVIELPRLTAKCLARNTGSYRVLEKLGFSLAGHSVIEKPRWPQPEKVAEFELTRAKWITGK